MRTFRIFLAIGGKAAPGDATHGMWIRNLYDPLVGLGHDVYLLNTDAFAEDLGHGYMSVEAKGRLSADLPGIFAREHAKKPFDLFLSYLHNGQIVPAVLKEIKKFVPTVNYSTNYHQFDMYREIASVVDFNIYISKIAREGFEAIGAKCYWMPLAANPAFYRPSHVKNEDVVFVGSAYGPRPHLFWRLLQYGINLQLFGTGWKDADRGKRITLKSALTKVAGILSSYQLRRILPSLEIEIANHYHALNVAILEMLRQNYAQHLHSPLSDQEYVRTLAEAGAVVNIQESRYNHDYLNHQVLFGSNLRDFETTMSGSFLCTQYSHEIEELFDVGKEIVCYHNEHDLAEKLAYYMKHPAEKTAIAARGHQRSLSSHTWQRRFHEFFDTLQL